MAAVSCADCRTYAYEMPSGRVSLVTLPGDVREKARRAPGSGTPCRLCPKVPAGAPAVPESACEWGERHWSAYEFWRECQAVGDFPDDPVVRWYSRLFGEAERSVRHSVEERRHRELVLALGKR